MNQGHDTYDSLSIHDPSDLPSTSSTPSTKHSAPLFDKTKLFPLDLRRLFKTINTTLSVRLVLPMCCPIRMASNA
jgi:hypothetical protein